jgi:hypothetical protein
LMEASCAVIFSCRFSPGRLRLSGDAWDSLQPRTLTRRPAIPGGCRHPRPETVPTKSGRKGDRGRTFWTGLRLISQARGGCLQIARLRDARVAPTLSGRVAGNGNLSTPFVVIAIVRERNSMLDQSGSGSMQAGQPTRISGLTYAAAENPTHPQMGRPAWAESPRDAGRLRL